MAKDDNGTKEYILKFGQEHEGFDKNGSRTTFKAGDSVMLSGAAAKAFRDKFESVEDITQRVKAQREVDELRDKQAKILAALEEKGIDLDDLLAGKEAPTPTPPSSPSGGGSTPTPIAPDSGKTTDQGTAKK